MLVYGPLKIYYSSIVEDANKFKMYENEYEKRLSLLESYDGTKSVNVDLGSQSVPSNPNLYIYTAR